MTPTPPSTDTSEEHYGSITYTRSYSLFLPCVLLITLFSTLLNLPSLFYDEVIDDHMLLHNIVERGCGNNFIECFQHPVFRLYYRPVLSSSFAVTVGMHGTAAWVHHFYNLFFHAAMVALAFWFFRLLFRRDTPAILAGTLFALHPLQVPVTTFIGGRTDTIALLFLMLYGIGAILAGQRQAQGRSILAPVVMSVFGFSVAVFTKEQVIPLLLLLPLLVRYGGRGGETEQNETGVPVVRPAGWWAFYLMPVAAYVILANRIIPRNSYEPAGWPAALHIEMVGRTLWYYAKALFFPVINTLHQSILGQWDSPQWGIMLLGFFCTGAWLAAVRFLWTNPALRFCWLWTTLTLLPCLNIIPIPSQFVAPYRAVIPALGVCGLLGYGFAVWVEQGTSKLVRPLFFLLSFLYACISLADLPHWRDDIALIRMEVAADPDYIPAQSGLAGLLQAKGRALEVNQRYDEAHTYYQLARKQYEEVLLPMLFPGAQSVEERIAYVPSPQLYRFIRGGSGLRYKPLEVVNSSVRGSGGTHQALGQVDLAINDYRVALAAKPDDIEVRDYLGYLYFQRGQYPLAEKTMRDTLARAPAAFRYIQLSELLLRSGRRKQAQEMLLDVMMRPDFASLPESDRQRASALYNELAKQQPSENVDR